MNLQNLKISNKSISTVFKNSFKISEPYKLFGFIFVNFGLNVPTIIFIYFFNFGLNWPQIIQTKRKRN